MELVTRIAAASGKAYEFAPGGLVPGARQYIDRDYIFDFIPGSPEGAICIRTAGDDKMILEDALSLRLHVSRPVTLYVVYADKLRVLPKWLSGYENTRAKVTRADSNTTTLKGIFTLFRRDFPAGSIALYGNLAPAMAADPALRAATGRDYCMYSVVVADSQAT